MGFDRSPLGLLDRAGAILEFDVLTRLHPPADLDAIIDVLDKAHQSCLFYKCVDVTAQAIRYYNQDEQPLPSQQ